jgi:FtsZ-binding cell division protein ZapB
MKVQTAHDQVLILNKMMEESKQVNASLVQEENSLKNSKPPYEIEWNQYEKVRMQADGELRRANTTLSQVLNRDTGILLGYEIAYRMKQ